MREESIRTITGSSPPLVDWGALEEGQLALDVIDTDSALIVVSPMAGAVSEQIEVYIHHDLLTIRGVRLSPASQKNGTLLFTECFWGKFSRSVVLPVDVYGERATATYANGILTIRIPKRQSASSIPVTIVEV